MSGISDEQDQRPTCGISNEWDPEEKRRGWSSPLLSQTTLVACSLFRSSPLTESPEQANLIPRTQRNAPSRPTPGALNAKQNSRQQSLCSKYFYVCCLLRYSPRTITTLQNMDLERIDVELLVRVITHISLHMEVQLPS